MSARFLRASSQYTFSPIAPITAYPFTVGCWVKMLSVSSAENFLWAISSNDGFTHYWHCAIDANEDFLFRVREGGSVGTATVSLGVITAGEWNYVICRGITSANRRLSVGRGPAAIQHAQDTTNLTPTSLDHITIGAHLGNVVTGPSDTEIGEFWYTHTDIQPGGLELDNALFRSLARYGPLSVPHVRDNLIEYLPLELSALGDKGDYFSNRGRKTWTNVGGATIAPPPPATLSESYVKLPNLAPWRRRAKAASAAASAAVTGTAVASITEADVVAGGKTIIITLTNDTWLTSAGGLFDLIRQDIIDGLDSAQSEGTGWNTEVRDNQGVAGVVRTSDTVVTITLDAQAAYDITAQETITVTVPITALTTGLAPLTGSPTFTVAIVSAAAIKQFMHHYKTMHAA